MPTATTDRAPRRTQATPLTLRAFGLELEPGFPIPGAAPGGAGGANPVRLDLASRAEILSAWAPAAPERISERRMPNGRIAVSIDGDERAGHLIRAHGFGCFWIAPDVSWIRCAPLRATAWRWQRYLVGQVLPLAAVLRGIEVFHASAVAIDGRAVALLGGSTAGKTSVAVSLVLGGARFMTDDVLAVSPAAGGGVMAHPGVGLASLRHSAGARLGPGALERLGRSIGRDRHASRLELDRHEEDAPLARVYALDRRGEPGRLRIEPLQPVDPRLLLGGSFNFVVRTPQRLENQLDICARIARGPGVRRVRVPAGIGPDDVARAIERDVAGR